MIEYVINNWMDVLGTCLGLLYLYLEIKENIWMWIVGLVMPMIYIVVLYKAGIYADCGMEVYYFLAGIYGLWCWMKKSGKTKKASDTLEISFVTKQMRLKLLAVTVFLWVALTLFLMYCTDSTIPVCDGFTTALSVVALWLSSRKFIEQWWMWFIVDGMSAGLYIYKGVYGRSILYAIYTVMAVYGYFAWRKKMKNAGEEQCER